MIFSIEINAKIVEGGRYKAVEKAANTETHRRRRCRRTGRHDDDLLLVALGYGRHLWSGDTSNNCYGPGAAGLMGENNFIASCQTKTNWRQQEGW